MKKIGFNRREGKPMIRLDYPLFCQGDKNPIKSYKIKQKGG